MADRATDDILIASPRIQLVRELKNGVTRKYSNQSLTMPLQRGVKVIGSSD